MGVAKSLWNANTMELLSHNDTFAVLSQCNRYELAMPGNVSCANLFHPRHHSMIMNTMGLIRGGRVRVASVTQLWAVGGTELPFRSKLEMIFDADWKVVQILMLSAPCETYKRQSEFVVSVNE